VNGLWVWAVRFAGCPLLVCSNIQRDLLEGQDLTLALQLPRLIPSFTLTGKLTITRPSRSRSMSAPSLLLCCSVYTFMGGCKILVTGTNIGL
jgi:hypothetical protein